MPTRRELAKQPCTSRLLTLFYTVGAFVTAGFTLKDWFFSTAFKPDENGEMVLSQKEFDEYLAITALTNITMGGIMLALLATSCTLGCIEEPGSVKLPPILATNGIVPIGITYSAVLASGILISLASADESTDETDPRLSAGLMLIILGITLRIALLSSVSSPENQGPWVKNANRYLDVVGKLIEVAKFQGVVGLLVSNDSSGFLFYVISRMVFLMFPPMLGSYFHISAHCNANHHGKDTDFKATPFRRSVAYAVINGLKGIAGLLLMGVILSDDSESKLGWFTAAQLLSILSDCLETFAAYLQYASPYWVLTEAAQAEQKALLSDAFAIDGSPAGLAPRATEFDGAPTAFGASASAAAVRPERELTDTRVICDEETGTATLFYRGKEIRLTQDQVDMLSVD